MTASIYGERWAGLDRPAWHGLGTVFTEPKTATEAVKLAGLDYEIVTVPFTVNVDGEDVESGRNVAIVRKRQGDDEAKILGTAKEGFTPIDNLDIARTLDPVTEAFPVDTVGALGDGETVFMFLRGGRVKVKNEYVAQYFGVTDGKAGNRALRIVETDVRVVCKNTLELAMGTLKGINVGIRHRGDVGGELDVQMGLVAQMKQMQQTAAAVWRRMADRNVSEADVDALIATVFPEPVKPQRTVNLENAALDGVSKARRDDLIGRREKAVARHEANIDRMNLMREAAKMQYVRIGDENPQIGGTLWAAYNAFTELATRRDGPRADYSNVFGNRRKETVDAAKAVTALMEA